MNPGIRSEQGGLNRGLDLGARVGSCEGMEEQEETVRWGQYDSSSGVGDNVDTVMERRDSGQGPLSSVLESYQQAEGPRRTARGATAKDRE